MSDAGSPPTSGSFDADCTVAIVLAAGAGTRFNGPHHKLDTDVGGHTLLARAVDTAVAAGLGPVVVVTGALRPALPGHVREVVNDDWVHGQATSLQAGIAAARRLGADAVVVGLGDQPSVTAAAWRAVAASRAAIAVATYAGERGNPVRLHSHVWPMLPTRGDAGARSLMRLHPELVEPVPCAGSAVDIDTQEDLQRWQSNSSTNSR